MKTFFLKHYMKGYFHRINELYTCVQHNMHQLWCKISVTQPKWQLRRFHSNHWICHLPIFSRFGGELTKLLMKIKYFCFEHTHAGTKQQVSYAWGFFEGKLSSGYFEKIFTSLRHSLNDMNWLLLHYLTANSIVFNEEKYK